MSAFDFLSINFCSSLKIPTLYTCEHYEREKNSRVNFLHHYSFLLNLIILQKLSSICYLAWDKSEVDYEWGIRGGNCERHYKFIQVIYRTFDEAELHVLLPSSSLIKSLAYSWTKCAGGWAKAREWKVKMEMERLYCWSRN